MFTPIGRFSMVCRDANTHRAREVNPLIISTLEEKALYAMGEGLLAPSACACFSLLHYFSQPRHEATTTDSSPSLAVSRAPKLG